ncbi:MAG: MBL fold metallo-hydrolase [Bacilli bacterium]|nr:MBL fold metallo-hydrolase [Bacilli bacterium]
MATLFYQGHASFRLTANNGTVVFIDPYEGVGYKTPANLVLISHEHYDHNDINKIIPADRCVVIRSKDALVNGTYYSFDLFGIHIQAVPAYNSHHNKAECVGWLIEVDGVKIYHAGDTDFTPEMEDLAKEGIDYALLPIDGFYTMSPMDAAKAADVMNAKHLIPMHCRPGMIWDIKQVMQVHSDKAMLVRPNDNIEL